MGADTKANTSKTKRMAAVVLPGLMGESTKEAGSTANKKVKAFTHSRMARANGDFGKKVKGFNGFEINSFLLSFS